MRLKRLELRGFKTFAAPAEFVFDSDLTAIVGPNGSGKSNVADALRWVLGEQSLRNLRSKRTEDVIFTGSSSRPPLGMAQVSLTLDNAAGRLPLPYSEVTLTRRAFRSGENEYALNGTRLRLRDLGDLLLRAGLGNGTYTIIGQGLVDQALSLRPEERREMFEEAADVKRYWLSIRETAARIADAEANARRVGDLLVEIEPRLRSLKRQAEAARLADQQRRELTAALAAAYLVERARLRAEATGLEARLEAAHSALAEARAALSSVERAETSAEAERAEVEAALEAARGAREAARTGLEAARAALALARERERAARAGLAAARAEVTRLDEAAERTATWTADRQAHREALQAALIRTETGLPALERELTERREAARLAAEALEAARAAVGARSNDLAAVAARLAALDGQRRRLERSSPTGGDGGDERIADLEATLAAGGAESAALAAEIERLAAELAAGREELRRIEERAAAVGEVATRAAREREVAAARLELLERAQESGAGLYPGVRAVLAAAGRPGGLEGIVGTVASLVRVPAEIETAIEVALGGHLQDIVTRGWREAEAAVEHLKATRSGRATFLPLDTLRASAPAAPPPEPGVLGVASALVEHAPELRVVVDHLLGRTLLVDSLATARRVLRRVGPAWQIVTLSGELVRASGAITGGSRAQEAQILGKDRELRELPARVDSLTARRDEAQRELAALADSARELRERLHAAEAAWRSALDRQAKLAQRLARAEQELLSARGAAEARAAQAAAAAAALADLDAQRAALLARQQAVEAELAAARDVQASAEEVERAARAGEREAAARLQAAGAEVAGLRQRLAEAAREIDRAEHEAASACERRAEAARRAEQLDGELGALVAAVREAEAAVAPAERALAEAETRLAPLRARLEALARERAARRSAVQAASARLREAEAAAIEAESGLRWARGERDALEAAMLGDLPMLKGEVDPRAALQRLASERPLPEEGRARRQLEAARARLRTLGGVDPEVVREYEEVRGRRDFLAAQLEDLRSGADSLREGMDQLRAVGQRRFSDAFEAIAGAFERHFRALFGGGRAQLALTEPGDPTATGIEIVAQPPGKRAQPLSLLSGGERALTATALIFAMLTVNPIPFCVLDEVDAALDEANVRRFLNVLRSLSAQTQFILVTHNRATMEAAGALYGVTMGRDGASQVVSLRVADLPAPDGRLAAD